MAGLPIQPNAPQTICNGRTIAAGAFVWNNPAGNMFRICCLENIAIDGWTDIGPIALYSAPGQCLADVQAKGGIMQYMAWLIAQFNAKFAAAFSNTSPTPGEPATDHDAMIAIEAGINALHFTIVNDVPTLST